MTPNVIQMRRTYPAFGKRFKYGQMLVVGKDIDQRQARTLLSLQKARPVKGEAVEVIPETEKKTKRRKRQSAD